jgi:hypothetical protein
LSTDTARRNARIEQTMSRVVFNVSRYCTASLPDRTTLVDCMPDNPTGEPARSSTTVCSTTGRTRMRKFEMARRTSELSWRQLDRAQQRALPLSASSNAHLFGLRCAPNCCSQMFRASVLRSCIATHASSRFFSPTESVSTHLNVQDAVGCDL